MSTAVEDLLRDQAEKLDRLLADLRKFVPMIPRLADAVMVDAKARQVEADAIAHQTQRTDAMVVNVGELTNEVVELIAKVEELSRQVERSARKGTASTKIIADKVDEFREEITGQHDLVKADEVGDRRAGWIKSTVREISASSIGTKIIIGLGLVGWLLHALIPALKAMHSNAGG